MDKELDETLGGAVNMLMRESLDAGVSIKPEEDLHIRVRPEQAPYLFQELTPDVNSPRGPKYEPNWRGVPIVVTKETAPERGCFVTRSPNGKGGGMKVSDGTITLTEHWQTEYIPVDLPQP